MMRENNSEISNYRKGEMSNSSSESTIVCYSPMMITTIGIWQGDNPLDYSLPLFILQLALIVVTTRLLVIILKPFHQPRVISEILVIHFLPLFLSSWQLF